MDSFIRNHQLIENPEVGFKPAWRRDVNCQRQNTIVLVVDDEEIVRLVLTEMLDRLGMSVITAADGIEALEIFKDYPHPIDVVIFDLSMPEMQGDELFYAIRQLNPEVKLILSSGLLDDVTVEELSEQGLNGYLPKPYTIDQIAALMDDVLRQS